MTLDATGAFSLLILAAVILFDVWVILKKGNQHSISVMVINLAYRYPWISFLAGFVCGHLFWQMKPVGVQ